MTEKAADNGRVSLAQVIRGELVAHCMRFNDWRNDHKEEHKEMENRIGEIEKLVPALRAVMWVGAGLGVSIIGLLWSLLTGQVQLLFR